jgi:predicted anti-sigma-YlaC factor YlaD
MSVPTRVPRNVIVDLLPIHLAGEASEETSALVEAALRDDPSLAALAEAYRSAPAEAPPDETAPDLELRTLRRTRRLLAWQRWLFGLAIGFTAVGLTTRVSLGARGVTGVRLLLIDHPLSFGVSLAAGMLCWAAYAVSRRRLRV